jgi:hypothetical protein
MHALQAVFLSVLVPLHRIRLVFHLYLAQLLFALVLAVPLSAALESHLGYSYTGFQMRTSTSFLEQAWSDLHSADRVHQQVRQDHLSPVAILWLFLSFTVLSGGTFWVLSGRQHTSTLAEFLGGAGRLFGRFCRLLIPYGLGCLGLYYLNGLLSEWVVAFTDSRQRQATSTELAWLLHGKLAIMALLFGWLTVSCALAKAAAARTDQRAMLATFFRSLLLSVRHPISTPILAALGPALLAVLLAAYAKLRDHLPTEDFVVTLGEKSLELTPAILLLALTQVLILCSQGVWVLWTATILRFHRSVTPPAAPPADVQDEPRPLLVVDRPMPRQGGAR